MLACYWHFLFFKVTEPLNNCPFEKAKIVRCAFLSHKNFQFGKRGMKRMFTADLYDDRKLMKVGLWMSENEAVGCRKGEISISEFGMAEGRVSGPGSKIFSLIRLKKQCRVPPVNIDFSSPYPSQTNPISITPTFHNDGCYFSPCFVLPSEKKEHLQNRQRLKCDFDEKIRVSLQENAEHTTNEEELRQALPNSKYCQLCQAQFEDYYYHINGKSHQTCTSHSHAQPFIQDLVSSMMSSSEPPKTKLLQKQPKPQVKPARSSPSNSAPYSRTRNGQSFQCRENELEGSQQEENQ